MDIYFYTHPDNICEFNLMICVTVLKLNIFRCSFAYFLKNDHSLSFHVFSFSFLENLRPLINQHFNSLMFLIYIYIYIRC